MCGSGFGVPPLDQLVLEVAQRVCVHRYRRLQEDTIGYVCEDRVLDGPASGEKGSKDRPCRSVL